MSQKRYFGQRTWMTAWMWKPSNHTKIYQNYGEALVCTQRNG